MYRQSSDTGEFGFHIVAPGKSPKSVSNIWTHVFGGVVQFRIVSGSVLSQLSTGRGCLNRRSPENAIIVVMGKTVADLMENCGGGGEDLVSGYFDKNGRRLTVPTKIKIPIRFEKSIFHEFKKEK